MTQQDQLIHLAFSIYNNKGAYSLLLGSGISRSAGIPTGYEITMEMVRQLATLNGENKDQDLEAWFKQKFNITPSYSDLLDRLGKTSTERQNFLKKFFEPTENEKEEGKKRPTDAHKSIAKMVALGLIRVIITTNFDRLLEQAIQDEGIIPTVISSPDAVDGAPPLVHSHCTIIKVNGDYLDIRTKNTVDELEKYDDRMNKLLDQVFDEFGLIICGWSGDWDTALRTRIEKTKNHRYNCYWCIKGKPTELANSLMDLRKATKVQIENSDKFFIELEEKITSLSELNRPHPLSALLMVESLKRFIVEDKHRIRLHDLIMNETNRVCKNLMNEDRYPMTGILPNSETIQKRIENYTTELSLLLPLFINLCFWASNKEHEELCIKTLDKITNCVPDGGGYTNWRDLRLFPACVLICAGGITAISNKRYSFLLKMLTGYKVKYLNHSDTPIEALLPYKILDQRIGQSLQNRTRQHTPINNIVFDILIPYFIEISSINDEFENAFDRFEYLTGMIYIDLKSYVNNDRLWVAPGRYTWKHEYNDHISKIIDKELIELSKDWPPLKDGLFSSSLDNAINSKKALDNSTSKFNRF